MRIEPKLDEIVYGKRGMLRGIEVCIKHQCLVSAVSLMFAAIDAVSALNRAIEKDDTDRSEFKKWVRDYLLPGSDLRCDESDLYAARCGVLHTYSSASRDARNNKARHLVYRWREGPTADADQPLPPDALEVPVESLHEALKQAVRKFLEDSEVDPDVRERVQHHLPSLLCYAPWPNLEAHVAA